MLRFARLDIKVFIFFTLKLHTNGLFVCQNSRRYIRSSHKFVPTFVYTFHVSIYKHTAIRDQFFFYFFFIEIHNLSNLDIWWHFLTVILACWWLPPAGYHPRVC